jgi:hypothetical protein
MEMSRRTRFSAIIAGVDGRARRYRRQTRAMNGAVIVLGVLDAVEALICDEKTT